MKKTFLFDQKDLKKEKNNIFYRFYQYVLDIIFPKYCVGCGLEGKWICQKCMQKIIFVNNQACFACNRLTSQGKFCQKCRTKTNLTGLITSAYYHEGPLKEAIHTYKYNFAYDLAHDLAKILLSTLRHVGWNKKALLVAVPLHKKRKAQRGFNQSEILAKIISAYFDYPIIKDKLIRTKFTKPQVELTGAKRKTNIKGIFAWIGKNEIKGKTIILVDDVCTTGSTLEECAKVLRKAGAKEIWGLVLAKI